MKMTRRAIIRSKYKMNIISKYIVNLKRKLCTVCVNGVHYEYVGDHDGECYSYAEYCPCEKETINKLILERANRIMKWH